MVDTCEKEIENFWGVRLQLQTDIFGEMQVCVGVNREADPKSKRC
jgi:hypothetical protein